jgi:AraC family transcriptional regulator, positive regulator of tynA and feaB
MVVLGVVEVQSSTAGLRPEVQFEAWRQVVSDTFVPVDLSRPRPRDEPGGFRSDIQARRLGDLALSWLRSAPQSVERRPGDIARVPGEVYFLNLITRGQGTAYQDGREATSAAGDFLLIDSGRPFSLDFTGDFEQLCLTIPRAMLDPQLASPQLCTAVRVAGDTPSGAIVTSGLQVLAAQRSTFSPRETLGVTEHLTALVALAVSEAVLAEPCMGRDALVQGIVDEIERRFADPDLTPAEAARSVAISVSYLTKLLHCRGTTFGHLLLERRLDHAWTMLDPRLSHTRTVTAIAASCGFRDSAHFARTFRARFGITPTQRRSGSSG